MVAPAAPVDLREFSSVPPPSGRIPGPGSFPGGVNASLQHAVLRHRHFVLMAENGALSDVLGPLRNARSTLVEQLARTAEQGGALGNLGLLMDQRRRFLKTRIDEIMSIAQVETTQAMREKLREFAEKEAGIQRNLLRREIPGQVSLDLVGPDLDRLRVMVEEPLGGAKFSARIKNTYGEMRHQMRSQLATSIALGEGMEEAARRLRGIMEDLGVRRSVVLARSEIQRVANRTAMDLYQRNQDVIKGMQWIATLDARTCPICGNLDGETYDVTSPPSTPPPAHAQCRCFMSPVTKSWRELGIDRDEMPATTRASMDGQVPANVKYKEWFANQPAEFQRRVLGPTRFKLLQAGELEFSDFADIKSARVIPVKDLPDVTDAAQGAAERSGASAAAGVFDNRLDFDDVVPLESALTRGMEATDPVGVTLSERAVAKAQVSRNLGRVLRSDPDFDRAFDALVKKGSFATDIRLSNLAGPTRSIRVRTGPGVDPGDVGKVTLADDAALSTEAKEKIASLVKDFRANNIGLRKMTDGLENLGLQEASERIRDEASVQLSSRLVKTWAQTSSDNHALAQALQNAAKREFGLDDAVTSHFGSTKPLFGSRTLTLEDLEEEFGDFFQRFQRAQYQATQEFFREEGIEAVTIFRGMRFDERPAWVGQGGSVASDIELQPLSSFSSDFSVSTDFASGFGGQRTSGVVVGMRVPVSRICSTARTGFGCLAEGEVVLLGGRFEGFAAALEDMSRADLTRFLELAEEAGFVVGG